MKKETLATNITKTTIKIHMLKLKSLKEMDNFLDSYNLSRVNHGGVGNLNRPVTSNEIITVIKNPSLRKSSGSGGFSIKFCKMFKQKQFQYFSHYFKY